MTDLAKTLAGLSPEKRKLLEKKLKEKGGKLNAFPLSYGQQRLWFLEQMESGTAAYNIPAAVHLKGSLNIEALQKSFEAIIKRHEILRTAFTTLNGKPVQIPAQSFSAPFDEVDLTEYDEKERSDRLHQQMEAISKTHFDLSKPPLFKTVLFRLQSDEHVLLLVMHHVISDGWSVGIFIYEFSRLYRRFLNGQSEDLPELKIQYADYAKWQNQWLKGERLQKELHFWQETLGQNPPVLELPTDYPRPAVKSYHGDHVRLKLSSTFENELKQATARHGVTHFMAFLAIFHILLHRYTSQEEILVGTPIANRNRSETQNLIGFFVNTLVLNLQLQGDATFEHVLKQTKQKALDAFSHQDVPFEMLVEKLQPERSLSHTPLFQVMFVHQTPDEAPLELPGLQIHSLPVSNKTAKFDLTFYINEQPDGLNLMVEYDTDLFSPSTMDRFLHHYEQLLHSALNDPKQPIARLPILTAEEKRQLLSEWVDYETRFEKSDCIHQLIEQQAAKQPDAVAVRMNGRVLNYKELNEQANRLAHYLIQKGTQPDQLIGVYMERRPELIVSLLAVLKSGAAYLPMDPVYPAERLRFMLEDAHVPMIISESDLAAQLPEHNAEVIDYDDVVIQLDAYGSENPQTPVKPDHLIYTIYTSGSTGKPKGTLITHHNVVRLLQATEHWFGFNETDVWTFFHSYAFDFSVWEIWGALVYGGSVVVVPYLVSRNPNDFYRLLIDEQVTVLNQTPSAFQQLIRAEENQSGEQEALALRYVIFGGEALEFNSLRPWFGRHGDRKPQLVNMYGITETTVHVTYRPVTKEDLETSKGSVIGRAIPDLQLYILDSYLQPSPIGVPGEICVGGAGLARGYLNRPVLTAEKFASNPFRENERLYRSGDLARYLPNGDIEYLGRIDNQVKVRGFRIELGEIETVINQHPSVSEALVIVREDVPGDQRIVAYVISGKDDGPDSETLRQYLRVPLPEYMVPSAFVFMDAFPLTANGKIDRRALPKPDAELLGTREAFVAPANETERLLADLYSEILNVEQVGALDHFFDLGGHSLLATQLISRIRDVFSVEPTLRQIFEDARIRPLAAVIEQLKKASEGGTKTPPIVKADRSQKLPLSFAQQRLWFLDQLQPGDAAYNIPSAFKIRGAFDVERFKRSIEFLVQRHESLRTLFHSVEGQPYQHILPNLTVNIPLIEMQEQSAEEDDKGISRYIEEEARKPFVLDEGPLFRIKILKLDEKNHVLLLTMHHIISDGWSMGVFIQEIAETYRALEQNRDPNLPPLNLQYADFAQWQRDWLKDHVLENELQYWKERLGHGSPALELPADFPRPKTQTANGKHLQFKLQPELTDKLRKLARKENTTMFMVLLAAFKTLLYRYTRQSDISVGTPIANRNRSEIENIIGFFVNTLVIRSELDGNQSFRQYLKQIRDVTLGAYAHQDIPFEKLVDAIHPERDTSHNPLFQVMFILQNLPTKAIDSGDITIESLDIENHLAQFDLTLAFTEGPDALHGNIEFNTDLFRETTIRRFADHLQKALQHIADAPGVRLSEIDFIARDEHNRQIYDWNDTAADLPALCIHRLIETQVKNRPDATAVESEGASLTYDELNKQANRLARYLIAQGIGTEDRIGVSIERSTDLIATLLAILKAGAAYVPLDPNYPQERLAFMMNDAGIALLLTQTGLQAQLPQTDTPVVNMDQLSDLNNYSDQNLEDVNSEPQNLAYVIYTSGSTGRPKGVLVSHQSLLNHNRAMIDWFALKSDDRVLQFSTINFDAAAEEIYPALQTGATLVLRSNEPLLSGEDLIKLIERKQLTVLDLPTAYWHQIVNELAEGGYAVPQSLRLLVLGGDKAAPDRLQKWQQISNGKCRILNTYGPTETTIVSSVHEIGPDDASLPDIPIGKGISNTRLYILDEHLKPTPLGVPGELFIAGIGLARGYLNRPDLSAEVFLPNPFVNDGKGGQRMYRTGDLVRYDPEGRIHFMGRVDDQVKVRGFRVETAEIESALLQHPHLQEVTILAREDSPGVKRLAAYCVPKVAQQLDDNDRRDHLRVPLAQKARLIRTDSKPYETDIGDISMGGLNLALESPFPTLEETVTLELELDEQTKPLSLNGEVRWIRKDKNQVGIRFIQLESQTQQHLQTTIRTIREETRVFAGELRGFLTAKLPDYMIPASFVLLNQLPYTPSGKIDRRALPVPDDMRPELQTEYVEAESDIETELAEIWRSLLGLKKVGMNDNFFELGGDSILSIQVIAKAKQKGLHFTPMQMFRYQTIRELAAVVTKGKTVQAEQGLVAGPAPLTPIQHWFFEQPFVELQHWNQSMLLKVRQPVESYLLEQTVDAVLAHHDALRLRFTHDNVHWQQTFAEPPSPVPFQWFDLSDRSPNEQKAEIKNRSEEIQASVDLSSGKPVKTAYFKLSEQEGRLLIVIHHLAVDGVSWRILLEDFQTVYNQLHAGQEIHLPAKSTSFKKWAERLKEYVPDGIGASEQEYWLALSNQTKPELETDFSGDDNTESAANSVSIQFDADATHALLQDVPPVYKTQINDILLTALAMAFSRWKGPQRLFINLEGHGREPLPGMEDVDVSRTVGWFTTLYPVLVDITGLYKPGELIKSIKEQLRRIPHNGIGFGLLRYLHEEETLRERLSKLDSAPISFNYLGQIDQAMDASTLFGPAPENRGAERSPRNQRSNLIDITAIIHDSRLSVSFVYSTAQFRNASIQSFSQFYKEALQRLIEHCKNPQARGHTASDFKLANLDDKKLDKVMSQLKKKKK